VTYAAGRNGMAAVFTSASPSVIVVPADARWNVAAFTIEAWVRPTAYPVGARGGILDCGDRAGLFLESDMALHCHATSLSVASDVVPLATWTHVACVFDTTTGLISVYQNGVFLRSGAIGALVNADTSDIGSDAPSGAVDFLDGRIDELRVWSVARTASQILDASTM
jgi:hypothetical protein